MSKFADKKFTLNLIAMIKRRIIKINSINFILFDVDEGGE